MAREGIPDYIQDSSDQTGKVKWFDPAKAYGFIDIDGGGSVFLHRNHANFDPAQGDLVKFAIANDLRRKRTYAVQVELA